MSDFVTPVRRLDLEQAISDLRAEFRDVVNAGRMWQTVIPNCLLSSGPSTAPNVTTDVGVVAESREYAYTAISDEMNRESVLSSSTPIVLAGEEAVVSAARVTDREVNSIGLYTRLLGGNALAWRLVDEVANPPSGTWTFTDNHTYGYYLGNDPPLSFVVPLQTVCGEGFRLRRVKVAVPWDYDPATAAYWQFGVEVRGDQATKPRWTVRQDTQKVGLQAARLYNIPMFHQGGEVPSTDLNLALAEDERVYFTRRGVGAVGPLPPLGVMVSVTREAG